MYTLYYVYKETQFGCVSRDPVMTRAVVNVGVAVIVFICYFAGLERFANACGCSDETNRGSAYTAASRYGCITNFPNAV